MKRVMRIIKTIKNPELATVVVKSITINFFRSFRLTNPYLIPLILLKYMSSQPWHFITLMPLIISLIVTMYLSVIEASVLDLPLAMKLTLNWNIQIKIQNKKVVNTKYQ